MFQADKYHDDHGGVLLLGYYDSGPGVWYTDEPQYYTGGTDTNCYKERSAKAYWYCWYDAYDDIVPLDHVYVQMFTNQRTTKQIFLLLIFHFNPLIFKTLI